MSDNSISKPVIIINTCKRNETTIALIVDDKIKKITKKEEAQKVPEIVDELLQENKLQITDVKSYVFLTGPGSFTGTRIGATFVNSLKFLKDVAIYEVAGDDVDIALEAIKSGRLKPADIVLPKYE